VIRDGAVAFRGKNYHRHCFTCKGGCGLELGGAEFAIKNGDCFCFDCYIEKFGRDCERCLEVVVGLGELRKITYENACWHPEVFKLAYFFCISGCYKRQGLKQREKFKTEEK
jgi:hypothetical protein